MNEVSAIAQFVDSNVFDILSILAALIVVPFLIRFQKNKESNKKRLSLFISMIPFLILSILALMY